MKKICLGFLVSLVFSMQAIGDGLIPYVGFNAQMRKSSFKEGYGKENFQPKMPQGEVLMGLKINPYLGFELGYVRTVERHRNATNLHPNCVLGAPLGSTEWDKANASSKLDGGNLSVIGFLPINDSIQLLGSLGIARLRVKLQYVPLGSDATPSYNQAEIEEGTRDFVSSKYIPQAKVGVQYMLTQRVGLKALLGWEGTKRFNLLTNKQGTPARVSLKDSYTVGLGLAWYFN